MDLAKLALHVPTILFPRSGIDLTRWAVIACDQYPAEPEYWAAVDQLVGDAPSTLRLIFPEVYLGKGGEAARIAAINSAMDQYLADGTLRELAPGFVLLDRQTDHAPSRKGLMVALDLEYYDYLPGAQTLIRATEGTILDRLPPRIRVREKAPIELPHIMVLIDDPERTVIEPLFVQTLPQLYDFPLMQNGGRLRGWHVADPALIEQFGRALVRLADPQQFSTRYGSDQVMLYAMGDGNHSFATAKAIWEQLKASAPDRAAIMAHPARYALVELGQRPRPGAGVRGHPPRPLRGRCRSVGLSFLRKFADDLGRSEVERVLALSLPLRARVAHMLLVLKDRSASVDDDGTLRIDLPLSRRDLASMLGARPESLSRVIRDLSDREVARFEARRVIVPDLDALIDEVERDREAQA